MNLELINKVKSSGVGDIELGRKKMYMLFPEYQHYKNRNGKLCETDYLCSYVVGIRKYNNNRISVYIVNLPKDYDGHKINLKDDDVELENVPMQIISLAKYEVSNKWEDFVHEESK